MPNWSDTDYQDALKAQEENPHPEFAKAIAEYERVHRLGAAEERSAGEGMITQQFPTMGDELPYAVIQKTPPTAGEKMARTRRPDAAGKEGMELALELRTHDPDLPSASKRKDIFTPPEYIIAQGEASPLEALRGYLPAWAGGGTEVWTEPAPPKGMKADSPEYQEYADRVWAERYAKAQANNENVVRVKYATGDAIADVALEAPMAGKAAAYGASDMVAPALITEALPWLEEKMGTAPAGEREGIHQLMDEYPVFTALGGIAGAMAPTGAAGALGKLTSKAVGLGREVASGVPSIGRGLAKGALAGAMTAVPLQAALDIGTIGSGREPSSIDEVDRLTATALGGGLFGAAAGFGGALSRGLRNPLSPSGKQLQFMDDALGRPATTGNPFNPIRVSPGVEAAMEESMGTGPRRGAAPYDILAQDVAPRIAGKAAAEDAALEASIVARNREYYERPGALAQKPGTSIVRAISGTLFKRTKEERVFPRRDISRAATPAGGTDTQNRATTPGGGHAAPVSDAADTIPTNIDVGIPGGASREPLLGADVNLYKRLYANAVDVIPDDGVVSNVREIAARELGEIMSARNARDFGANVPDDLPDTARVVVVPKRMNAKQYDEIVYDIDQLAKADARAGARDRELGFLQKAIREDRGQFPGLNELHSESEKLLADLQFRMQQAGIPQGDNVPELNRIEGVKKSAQGFRGEGRDTEDQALMSFLEDPGPLHQIAAARGANALMQPGLSRTGALSRAALVVDPAARAAAKFGMPAAAALGGPAGVEAREFGKTTKKAAKNVGRKTKRFLTEDDKEKRHE